MYIFPYQESWRSAYQKALVDLTRSADIDIEYHHIGSTSVVGLYSKNCIDILGVIDKFARGKELIGPLQRLGYEYRGEYGIKKRHYFSKLGNPKFHIHVLPKGHEQIERHLDFKKVMMERSDLRADLNELKMRLHQQFSKEEYQDHKADFYKTIHTAVR